MSIEDNFFAKKFQEIEEDIRELKKLQANNKMEYDKTSVVSMAEGDIKKSY